MRYGGVGGLRSLSPALKALVASPRMRTTEKGRWEMKSIRCIRMFVVSTVLAVCVIISGETARGDFVFREPIKVPYTGVSEMAYPQISRDGLELYFKNTEADQCTNIWVMGRSSTKEEWREPVRLDPPVNSEWLAAAPCISSDGLELYFSDVYYSGPCLSNPSGYGGGDLWVSIRTSKDDPWGVPENLGPAVNSAATENAPSLSADGLSLYFQSWRPNGGHGYYDLYVSTRAGKSDLWGPAENVGLPVNTGKHEATPFISPDGLSLFFSAGAHQLEFVSNIYVSQRRTVSSPWGSPVLFAPVQMPGLEFNLSFSENDSTLYFSNSDDFYGMHDLWKIEVTPVVDFNVDGIVNALDVLLMVEDWGNVGGRTGKTTLCDIAPFPVGDGVVDAKDLLVLAEYMIEGIPLADEAETTDD